MLGGKIFDIPNFLHYFCTQIWTYKRTQLYYNYIFWSDENYKQQGVQGEAESLL